ncbi:hypothetical protein [Tenacibaculum ovolyticum]|uniref:hypothetical protein n=1 Tax=Tenacibaculum ovolyticum TaxID=104270 RepID=UPI000A902E13|nr:hypothetical protein [Tenacibaculum ovolyticum]
MKTKFLTLAFLLISITFFAQSDFNRGVKFPKAKQSTTVAKIPLLKGSKNKLNYFISTTDFIKDLDLVTQTDLSDFKPEIPSITQNLLLFETKGAFRINHDVALGNHPVQYYSQGKGAVSLASYDTSRGGANTSKADYSFNAGRNLSGSSFGQVTLGLNNVIIHGDRTAWKSSDLQFVVGIGKSSVERKNGLVVLKNGVVSAPELSYEKIINNWNFTSPDKKRTLITLEFLKTEMGITNPGRYDRDIINLNKELWVKELRITGLNDAPTSSTATGSPGQIRYDEDFIYMCIASNTWKRIALTTF